MTAVAPEAAAACESCGAPLGHDQEWCLECGSARTLIHRPPDWRIPIAIVATVVLAAAIAFAIALINISNGSNRASAATTPAAGHATAAGSSPTPASTTSQSATQPPALAGWAVGLPGFTVAIASSPDEATARATAVGVTDSGLRVGLLDSSQHPAMAPGQWVVFAGRYPTRAQARASVLKIWQKGFRDARVRLVGRAGAP